MGAAENDRKHGDLDGGAMGFMTQWLTKQHLANMGERIHMRIFICREMV